MRTNRVLSGLIPALAIAAAFAAVDVLPAAAAELPPGQLLRLDGTDHLWVVDSQGAAHLAAGPDALAGKPVDWAGVRVETVDGLAALPKGAPYLTADLVKIGDAIYVPRFAADGTTPTLLRVQSPADLALLGVTDANYGQLVLDPAAWQQRYGVDPRRLPADEFRLFPAPVVVPAPESSVDSVGSTETATA
jgi:hypothetical protein